MHVWVAGRKPKTTNSAPYLAVLSLDTSHSLLMPSPGHPVTSFSISFSISLPVTPSPSACAPACLAYLPALMHFPSHHPITVHKILICSGLILLTVGPSFFSSDRFFSLRQCWESYECVSFYIYNSSFTSLVYIHKELICSGTISFLWRFGLGMDLTLFVGKAARKRILIHVHKPLATIVYMNFFLGAFWLHPSGSHTDGWLTLLHLHKQQIRSLKMLAYIYIISFGRSLYLTPLQRSFFARNGLCFGFGNGTRREIVG